MRANAIMENAERNLPTVKEEGLPLLVEDVRRAMMGGMGGVVVSRSRVIVEVRRGS